MLTHALCYGHVDDSYWMAPHPPFKSLPEGRALRPSCVLTHACADAVAPRAAPCADTVAAEGTREKMFDIRAVGNTIRGAVLVDGDFPQR